MSILKIPSRCSRLTQSIRSEESTMLCVHRCNIDFNPVLSPDDCRSSTDTENYAISDITFATPSRNVTSYSEILYRRATMAGVALYTCELFCQIVCVCVFWLSLLLDKKLTSLQDNELLCAKKKRSKLARKKRGDIIFFGNVLTSFSIFCFEYQVVLQSIYPCF